MWDGGVVGWETAWTMFLHMRFVLREISSCRIFYLMHFLRKPFLLRGILIVRGVWVGGSLRFVLREVWWMGHLYLEEFR